MKLEINLKEYSRPFIYEIAKRTTSPEILDQIVDFAINVDHYAESEGYDSDTDLYMDSVVDNEHLSKESIEKLIRYHGANDIHWSLANGNKIKGELTELFMSEVEDLSAIEKYFDKNTVCRKHADIVAERLVSGSIHTENCFCYTPGNNFDEVNGAISKICQICSGDKAKQLEAWLEKESEKLRWNRNGFADSIAELIMSTSTDAKLPGYNKVYMNNAIDDIAICCSDEVAARLKSWWREIKNS